MDTFTNLPISRQNGKPMSEGKLKRLKKRGISFQQIVYIFTII